MPATMHMISTCNPAHDSLMFKCVVQVQVQTFSSLACAELRSSIASQLVSLQTECKHFLSRWDCIVHTVTTPTDELLAFAISSSENLGGKVVVHHLHVSSGYRRRGLATALLDLCERSSTSRGRTSPTLEISVQTTNAEAQSYLLNVGFVQVREIAMGGVLVMQRKR